MDFYGARSCQKILPFIMCTGVAYVVLYPIQGLHNHDQICLTHYMETTAWNNWTFKVANYLQMTLPMVPDGCRGLQLPTVEI